MTFGTIDRLSLYRFGSSQQGDAGASGATGVSGISGATGVSGATGISGISGTQGISGARGVGGGMRYVGSYTMTVQTRPGPPDNFVTYDTGIVLPDLTTTSTRCYLVVYGATYGVYVFISAAILAAAPAATAGNMGLDISGGDFFYHELDSFIYFGRTADNKLLINPNAFAAGTVFPHTREILVYT